MKTNWQDPGSGEILSTYISGLQEAVGKIEDTLQPSITSVTSVTLEEIPIYEGERYRIYQSPGKRNWVASPAPVIKVNEVVKDSGYTIEYGGGGVVFNPPLSAGDVVTADFSYVAGGSGALAEAQAKADTADQKITSHKAAAAPHSGHETPAGAQAKAEAAAGAVQAELAGHLADDTKHITSTERTIWNSKQDAIGYTPVNKAGDTMLGDLKVNGNVVAGTELIVGYNGTTESLQRHKWKYNGSTGYLELWRYSNQNKWELSVTFPNRNTGDGGLVVENEQMATESYVNNKVKTDVPANAKFTDTITTINGKTGAITKADIVALGIPAQDTVYTHPDKHAISEVDGLQTALNGKVNTSQVLTNVPAGAVFTDTVTTINGKTGAITKADIVALGIPAQDTNTTYAEITTAEIDAGTSSTLRTITARRLKYLLDKIVALFPTKTSELTNDSGFLTSVTKSDVGLGNVDNVKQASKTEFNSHNNDTTRHITTEERTRWNNKAEVSQIPTKVSELENDANYVTQEELGNAGYGNMMKAVYDTNDDGIVDVAETVIGNEIQLGSYKLVYNSTTNSLDIEVVA